MSKYLFVPAYRRETDTLVSNSLEPTFCFAIDLYTGDACFEKMLRGLMNVRAGMKILARTIADTRELGLASDHLAFEMIGTTARILVGDLSRGEAGMWLKQQLDGSILSWVKEMSQEDLDALTVSADWIDVKLLLSHQDFVYPPDDYTGICMFEAVLSPGSKYGTTLFSEVIEYKDVVKILEGVL